MLSYFLISFLELSFLKLSRKIMDVAFSDDDEEAAGFQEAPPNDNKHDEEEDEETKIIDPRPRNHNNPPAGAPVISRADQAVAAIHAPAAHVPESAKSALDKLVDAGFRMAGELEESLLTELLDELRKKWIFPRVDIRTESYALFGLAVDMTPDDEAVQQAYYKALLQAFRVYMLFVANDMVSSDTDETTEIRRTFSGIFETIAFTYEYLSSEHRIRIITDNVSNSVSEALVPLDIQLFRFSFPDYSQNNDYQNLLIYLLHTMYKMGYRKYRQCCYEQIKTEDGYLTHAWREVCTVLQFIHRVVAKHINYKQWLNLTRARDTANAASKHLLDSIDTEFPELFPDRHIFATKQGIYDATTCAFFPYASADLNQEVTAINYFNVDVPMEIWSNEDWYSIDTDSIQGIYTHQNMPEDAIRWMYVFSGRIVFWVNELDTWQVILFIKGVAGTGKSTFGRVVSSFYPAADVAILSTNIERKFGLANVYDKLLFVCYEVRNNFGLEQAEFQSMVSGEEMSVARKFMNPVTVKWQVPGILLGNEVPSWVDVAGSVNRRTILGEFKEKVHAPDPLLHLKLFRQLVPILHKSVIAYQEAVFKYGQADIWTNLPEYFHETRRNLAASVNSLTAFIMKSDQVERAPDRYMPFKEFNELYQNYCKARRVIMVRMVADNYESIFESCGVVCETSPRIMCGQLVTQQYLVNIGVRGVPSGQPAAFGGGGGGGMGGGGGGAHGGGAGAVPNAFAFIGD